MTADMHLILKKEALAPGIVRLRVDAPLVAHGARAGQFCMVRPKGGERIPLTLADWNRQAGWVEVIFLRVGATTHCLAELHPGEYLSDRKSVV